MASESSRDRRWWILAFLCVSLIIINLNNTILNVALPTFVRDPHATSSQLEWIVDAYILIFAGLLLTCGSVGDRFGRRKALIVGLLVFIVFSVVAANCHTADHLIVSRGLMGIGAAIIMPATLSILTNVFLEGERIHAIGLGGHRHPLRSNRRRLAAGALQLWLDLLRQHPGRAGWSGGSGLRHA